MPVHTPRVVYANILINCSHSLGNGEQYETLAKTIPCAHSFIGG